MGGRKLLYIISVLTVVVSLFMVPLQTISAPVDEFADLQNLAVSGTNGNILISETSGTKYYYVGLYRNLINSSSSADPYLFEREDKQIYVIVDDSGWIISYYKPSSKTLNYQDELRLSFQQVKGFGNALDPVRPTNPANFYIVSGKVTGTLDLKDFAAKAQDNTIDLQDLFSSTSSGGSIMFRVGEGGPTITQGYVNDDGTFEMFHDWISGIIKWKEPNSIFMNTDRNTKIQVYAWYKDLNGQLWDGTKTLDLNSDFRVHGTNPAGRVYTNAPLEIKMAPTTKPLFTEASDITVNGYNSALSGAIMTFGSWLQVTTRWVMGQIDGLLNHTANYVVGQIGCAGNTCGVLGPWTAMRNIGLTLLIMVLIIIAFANVLQIDIEQYGLNRMIPKIILALILAYFSWIIVVFFFDFTQAIQTQALGLLGGTEGLKVLGDISVGTTSAGSTLTNIASALLILVILVGVLVCGVVLLFTLVMRIVMLSFLLSVAPLAFILNIVPFTASLYKQWWSEFWKWMFMGPLALVIISLGSIIAASVSGGSFSGGSLDASTVSSDSGGRLLIGLLIFGASMYVAATLPMQWGGKIMQGWGKFGKNAWGKTGGAMLKSGWDSTGGRAINRIGGVLKGRSELMKQRDAMWSAEKRAQIAKSGAGRTLITGGDKNQAAAMADAMEKNYEGYYSRSNANELIQEYGASGNNPAKQRAIAKIMQSKYKDARKLYAGAGELTADGDWVNTDPATRKVLDESALTKAASNAGFQTLLQSDRNFRNQMSDDNPELVIAAASQMASTGTPEQAAMAAQMYGQIASSNASKSFSQKNHKYLGATKDAYEKIKGDAGTFSKSSSAYATGIGQKMKDEQIASMLMKDAGLSEYDATAFIQAQKMATRWNGMKEVDQRKELVRANDKVAGSITGLMGSVGEAIGPMLGPWQQQ